MASGNLNVALTLGVNGSSRIFSPGGMLRPPTLDPLGPETEPMPRDRRADVVICGVGAIAPEGRRGGGRDA